MSRKRIQIILLCEDKQHKSFVYRFLKKSGIHTGEIRVRISPLGNGSGEKFVRDSFTQELSYYRSRTASAVFITMIDGDTLGICGRINQLRKECDKANIPFRSKEEAVMIAVPTRNIETWIHYLTGNQVDEQTRYPKLERQGNCQPAVNRLLEICNNKEPIIGCPSLSAACEEYNKAFYL